MCYCIACEQGRLCACILYIVTELGDQFTAESGGVDSNRWQANRYL